jgi:hypothetical protein
MISRAVGTVDALCELLVHWSQTGVHLSYSPSREAVEKLKARTEGAVNGDNAGHLEFPNFAHVKTRER